MEEVFAEFKRQLDALRDLIYAEIKRVNEENARILLRLDQMEKVQRRGEKYGIKS
jgi:hypothetical protein